MVDISLRDLDAQMAKAQKIAQRSKQDQVIYKSTDRLRYEIYIITQEEGFAGNVFRTIRYAGEDKGKTILRDTENIEPVVIGKKSRTTKPKPRTATK